LFFLPFFEERCKYSVMKRKKARAKRIKFPLFAINWSTSSKTGALPNFSD